MGVDMRRASTEMKGRIRRAWKLGDGHLNLFHSYLITLAQKHVLFNPPEKTFITMQDFVVSDVGQRTLLFHRDRSNPMYCLSIQKGKRIQ